MIGSQAYDIQTSQRAYGNNLIYATRTVVCLYCIVFTLSYFSKNLKAIRAISPNPFPFIFPLFSFKGTDFLWDFTLAHEFIVLAVK